MLVRIHKKQLLFMSAMIFILSLTLLGCSGSSESLENSATTSEGSNMITFTWPRDVGEMNPHVYNPSQMFAQSMVYETLVSYQDGGELKPQLAESWEISKDGKEYVFNLRQGVEFSDGSSFNAEIVKKNFDTILDHRERHGWFHR